MAERLDADDHRLMEQTALGDREAFTALVRRHQRSVLSIAYRFLADRTQAEDAAQEVFLRLWRSAGRYRPEKPFEAYIRTLTVNHCLDLRRKPRLVSLTEREEPHGPQDPHRDLVASERRVVLNRVIQSLPPAQRMALILFHYEALTVKEVALLLDSSPKAVESLLSRARSALRERLEPLLR